MTQTVKISDARNNLSRLVNEVFRGNIRVLVEKTGIPVAALVSAADLERLQDLRRAESPEPTQQGAGKDVRAHLTDQDREMMVAVLKRHGVERAAIFGSFARGDATTESDIDILIEPPEDMSLFGHVGLKHDLEDTLRRSVDLVTYKALHPLLREGILAEQQTIL